MEYTVVIRSLGKAGEKYQEELDSLMEQTIKPTEILVYLAEGYDIPQETCGQERYIYVPKGMVAQRALRYPEVKTEFILFLDDDVFLPSDAVERMYKELMAADAQVISPDVFHNYEAPLKKKIIQSIMGKEFCRFYDNGWAYKVLRTGGFSYCNNPTKAYLRSQSNGGPCFFCRKEDFLRIHFEDELWLDDVPYALPEDQIMYFKMHLLGMNILTTYDTGIVHLDAGSTMSNLPERISNLIRSEYRNKIVFWHRFFYSQDSTLFRIWDICCIVYVVLFQSLKALIKAVSGNTLHAKALMGGLKDGFSFICSEKYKQIPQIDHA